MADEARRGCGYRKVGGLYLVADGLGEPCHRLPIPLDCCPTCGAGMRPARGWTWIAPALLGAPCVSTVDLQAHCAVCPICRMEPAPGDRFGLLWIGEEHYTPEAFAAEAARLGVSRRIAALPRGFVLGAMWVLLAHRRACEWHGTAEADSGEHHRMPGVFHAFRPSRVELILRASDATSERIERERARGVTVVAVPDGDPDHEPPADAAATARRLARRARETAPTENPRQRGLFDSEGA